MAGLEGRCKLLIGLGDALEARPEVAEGGRPGDMLGESIIDPIVTWRSYAERWRPVQPAAIDPVIIRLQPQTTSNHT